MPTLVVFITLALTLAMLLTLIVLIPWLRRDKAGVHNQLIALNIEVFQDRIDELSHDYEAGVISKDAFVEQKTELERQLLQANQDNAATAPSVMLSHASEGAIQPAAKMITIPNRRSRLIVLISIPLLMALGYVLISDPKPTNELWQAQDKLGQVADDLLTGKIESPPKWATEDNIALFSALQLNVYHNSHDAERWMRLANIFMAFEADEPAFESISRAYRLKPSDSLIATRFAQVQFFTHGGQLNRQGLQALNTVLTQDPNHQGAMMLMIMSEVQAGRFDDAQQWVNRIRTSIKNSSGDHSVALDSLDELTETIAKQKALSMGQSVEANPLNSDNSDSGTDAAAMLSAVTINISINPSLLPLVTPNDILFVTVKPAVGGAPLAAKRIPMVNIDQLKAQLSDAGLAVQLSDADAMMPERTISSAIAADTALVVTARISKTGQASSQSGDLSASPVPIDDTKQTINIEINSQVQ